MPHVLLQILQPPRRSRQHSHFWRLSHSQPDRPGSAWGHHWWALMMFKKKSRIRTYQAFHRPGVRIVQPQIFQICPELKNQLPSKLWFCMSFWHEAQRSHGTVKSTGCSESSQRLVYAVLQRHEVLLNPTDHLQQTHRPALNDLIMPPIMVYPKLWYTIKICQNIPKLRLL